MPELTKTFFEKVLRDSENNDELQVTKVKVSNGKEFGSHFCSEVHSLEVIAKTKSSYKEYLDAFLLVVKSQLSET
jgi:urate oxidase